MTYPHGFLHHHRKTATIVGAAALVIGFACSLDASAQALTQTSKELGFGYRFLESKQVNVPGRWYTRNRFKFLYFEKRYLCQCSEFSISPNGAYAIFQDSHNHSISSFEKATNKVTALSKIPEGRLKAVVWDKSEKKPEIETTTGEEAQEISTKTKVKLK